MIRTRQTHGSDYIEVYEDDYRDLLKLLAECYYELGEPAPRMNLWEDIKNLAFDGKDPPDPRFGGRQDT